MIDIQTQTCGQTLTSPVNVMFVECDAAFVDAMAVQLLKKQLCWDSVTFSELEQCLESRVIIGAVVFGQSIGLQANPEAIDDVLAHLQKRCIASFFIDFPPTQVTDKPLVSVLAPETTHELLARLETAVLYARKDQGCGGKHDLHEDTAEQLEMAGQVQRNFLPARLPHTDRIRWAAMFCPAQWVSGDIYDIARLDETHIGFYLADAVGHSMPAALLTIFLKQATVMRQTIGNDYRIFEPSEVVANLNQSMAQQDFSGCLFATSCYGLLNSETLELRMARAGHPYPILIRDHKPQCLQSRGGLLGVFGEAKFEQYTVQLQTGDKLFVYSDGGEPLIGEARNDGALNFSKDFLDICRLPVEEMVQAYDHMARHHRFGPGELDDVTAVALEILP